MEFLIMVGLYLVINWIWPDDPSTSSGNDVFIPFEDRCKQQAQQAQQEFEDKPEYHPYENEDFGEF